MPQELAFMRLYSKEMTQKIKWALCVKDIITLHIYDYQILKIGFLLSIQILVGTLYKSSVNAESDIIAIRVLLSLKQLNKQF